MATIIVAGSGDAGGDDEWNGAYVNGGETYLGYPVYELDPSHFLYYDGSAAYGYYWLLGGDPATVIPVYGGGSSSSPNTSAGLWHLIDETDFGTYPPTSVSGGADIGPPPVTPAGVFVRRKPAWF